MNDPIWFGFIAAVKQYMRTKRVFGFYRNNNISWQHFPICNDESLILNFT